MNQTEAQMMILGVQQGAFYAVAEAHRKAFADELERIAKELVTYASKPSSYFLLPEGYEITWQASRNSKRSRRLKGRKRRTSRSWANGRRGGR